MRYYEMVVTIKKIGSDELGPGPCPVCGKPIPASPRAGRQRRYCSFTCSNKTWDHTKGPRPGKWEERICVVCGAHFTVRHYKATKTCSRKCGAALTPIKKRDPAKRKRVACAECTVEFEVFARSTQRWCSFSCRTKAYMRQAHPPITVICEQCEQPFRTILSKATARFCCSLCWGRWQAEHESGPASRHWRGGKHFYYGPSWQRARRAVLRRDKQCRDCGALKSAGGRSLEVHHLTQFRVFGVDRHEEANDLANLVVLCQQCHLTVEWNTHWRKPVAA